MNKDEKPCEVCGFTLWVVVGRLTVCTVGLYDDARFPGRLIVRLDEHFDHLEDLPELLAASLMSDLQAASRLLRKVVDAERVNVAVLGNQESHVHAHLVPRKPIHEPSPHKSPWNDTRKREDLSDFDRAALIAELTEAFR